MTEVSSINNKVKGYSMYSNIKNIASGKGLSFDIVGLDASIVNGLRRTILNDIVNLAFRYESGEKSIIVKKNTTGLHDEFISHRISLLPVMVDKWLESPGDVNIDNYSFVLNVSESSQQKKGGLVTTDDITVKFNNNGFVTEIDPKKCFYRDKKFDSPILVTRFPNRDSSDQELNVEFTLTKGTHSDHACYSPTVFCVSFEKENEHSEEKVHEFKLESIGIWSPYKLVQQGFLNLIYKCKNIYKKVENNESGHKYKGNYMAIDYRLDGESHTIGNMIQEWIYNAEFTDKLDGKNLSHISYHEPHPLENHIIVRFVLKEKKAPKDFDAYKQKTDELFLKYVRELEDFLTNCLMNWKKTTKSDSKRSLL
tara:strand:- start:1778 stop:2878 length:1101 start_codon:yes stop_codon:yes gene_type:complete